MLLLLLFTFAALTSFMNPHGPPLPFKRPTGPRAFAAGRQVHRLAVDLKLGGNLIRRGRLYGHVKRALRPVGFEEYVSNDIGIRERCGEVGIEIELHTAKLTNHPARFRFDDIRG